MTGGVIIKGSHYYRPTLYRA